MQTAIEAAVLQADRWRRDGTWKTSDADTTLARELRANLDQLAHPDGAHEAVACAGWLERLREALAALAVAAATSRTPMGWFLGECAAALAPVMRWQPHGVGERAVVLIPTIEEITDAEHAFARIREALNTTHTT